MYTLQFKSVLFCTHTVLQKKQTHSTVTKKLWQIYLQQFYTVTALNWTTNCQWYYSAFLNEINGILTHIKHKCISLCIWKATGDKTLKMKCMILHNANMHSFTMLPWQFWTSFCNLHTHSLIMVKHFLKLLNILWTSWSHAVCSIGRLSLVSLLGCLLPSLNMGEINWKSYMYSKHKEC